MATPLPFTTGAGNFVSTECTVSKVRVSQKSSVLSAPLTTYLPIADQSNVFTPDGHIHEHNNVVVTIEI